MTDTQLTTIEQNELEQCEAVIEKGLHTFVDVGGALLKVRDKKLYRQNYPTFEEYCEDKWGWERTRAYRLMDAAKVVENVAHGQQIVSSIRARGE